MTRAVLILGLTLIGRTILAYPSGMETTECMGCHNGGQTPSVDVTFDPPAPNAGDTVHITVKVGARNGNSGGVSLTATVTTDGTDKGRLVITDRDYTRKGSSAQSFIHSQPKPKGGDNTVTFMADWIAPPQEGSVRFEVAGLSANADSSRNGDASAFVEEGITFGCVGKTFYRDFDLDGYGGKDAAPVQLCALVRGYSASRDDCNENDDRIHPGVNELCNGRDDDCDGQTDEGLSDETLYPDEDHDGYGRPGTSVKGCPGPGYGIGTSDCDDDDSSTYPGASEICDNADNDCDGSVDEGVHPTCGIGRCAREARGCSLSDCTPGRATAEVCNGLDDDCDGTVDDSATCSDGGVCVDSICNGGSDEDVEDEQDGASGDNGDLPTTGCVAAPVAPFVLALLVAGWRRRRARA